MKCEQQKIIHDTDGNVKWPHRPWSHEEVKNSLVESTKTSDTTAETDADPTRATADP